VAQDVKTIFALLLTQSAFPLFGKFKLVQVFPEEYMARKKSNAYPQFASLQRQQIFNFVGLGAFHQLFGPAAALGSPPEAQVPPLQPTFDDFSS